MMKLTGKVINNYVHKNKEGRIKSNRNKNVKKSSVKRKEQKNAHIKHKI